MTNLERLIAAFPEHEIDYVLVDEETEDVQMTVDDKCVSVYCFYSDLYGSDEIDYELLYEGISKFINSLNS